MAHLTQVDIVVKYMDAHGLIDRGLTINQAV